METTVICLANSKKEGERCIAGIDVRTGQWVRPVSRHTSKGEVPFRERQVAGQEPQLLDLIVMDIAHEGPTGFEYCHAKENRWIDPTPWAKIGEASVADIRRYLACDNQILHSRSKYAHPSTIEAKPLSLRSSLELREVRVLELEQASGKWKATLTTAEGVDLRGISVTDCHLIEQLNGGSELLRTGYATLSLSIPWEPPIQDWDEGPVGWKLLAGWIPAQP